jgi:hypothetical protein
VFSHGKIVPGEEFENGAITSWNAMIRWSMLVAKENEDEDFPNPRFKKRKEIFLC